MKKLKVPFVSMGILYLNDNQHSEKITKAIIDSDLTVLGYMGDTPDRSVNSQLHNSKYFKAGSDPSYFRLADRDHALEHLEVRLALFALLEQRPLDELMIKDIVEFTFIGNKGNKLTAVRNPNGPGIAGSTSSIHKIVIPDSISIGDIEEKLKARRVNK